MTDIIANASARPERPAFPTEREAFRVWLRIALLSPADLRDRSR